MNKALVNPTRNQSVPLCHLPGTFFKDLQTKFPETFHACSGIHQSWFTLPFFTKNHLNRAMPQHTPATCVGTFPARLVSLYVTFKNPPPRPIRTHATRRGQSDSRLEATPRNRSTVHVRSFLLPPLARWVPIHPRSRLIITPPQGLMPRFCAPTNHGEGQRRLQRWRE